MDARNEIKAVLEAINHLEQAELPQWKKAIVENICHYLKQDLKMLCGQLFYTDLREEFK